METFDFVIVGGGSAGCVLASRLSSDARYRVCLLEAGPADNSPFIRVPAGIIPLFRSKTYNWHYWTQADAGCDNRSLFWPRGRTLGGSSAINAMCYIRGHASDYDHWAELGNSGWSYADVLPWFKRSERYEPALDDPSLLPWHGTRGPLNVARRRYDSPLSAVFLEAARQAGYTDNDDFNGAEQEGFGSYKVFQKDGQRCSNAHAYLGQARNRPNLDIRTESHAARVLFDGRRAVGVRYLRGDRVHEVRATQEVILCGGAIGSPQLLMLSGIGPAAHLAEHRIELIQDMPAVGQNLQDHLDVVVSMRSKTRLGMSFHPRSTWRNLSGLTRYAMKKDGELSSNIAEVGGFLRSSPEEAVPDLQMHFAPLVNSKHGLDLGNVFRNFGYTILTCDLRPESRGQIKLASANPLDHPAIHPNYIATETDLRKLVIGLQKAREILAQPAFAEHNDIELDPGPDVRTDDELASWVRGHAETLYHPVGTCRMGVDADSVVDPQLRVRGVEALRVVDASIMPTLVGGNTNAPTTMIAEKAADGILRDAA
jgi:choline dehydrogenase